MEIKQKEEQTQDNNMPKYRRYWPVPPVTPAVYEYQNVNKDVNLRKNVTQFFHHKVLKWMKTESKLKSKSLNSIDGQMYIYHLLKLFIRKSRINWYDLRDNYSLIKEYLIKKLSSS